MDVIMHHLGLEMGTISRNLPRVSPVDSCFVLVLLGAGERFFFQNPGLCGPPLGVKIKSIPNLN